MKDSLLDTVRENARGRWLDILVALAPALADACARPGKHVPCPVHGGKDGFRLFKDAREAGGGICNTCNNGGAMGHGFDVLRWVNGWDFSRALAEVAGCLGIDKQSGRAANVKPPTRDGTAPGARRDDAGGETSDGRMKYLNALWKEAAPDPGRIADYLRHRGLSGQAPEGLRYHPALPYYEDGKEGGVFPAMLARVQALEGEVVAIHRTYLDPAGPGKAPLSSPKKLTPAVRDGATRGAAIRLAEAAQTLALAEGIETALAVLEATGTPAWATVSAGGMEAVELPSGVRRVEIWADHDQSGRGQQAAEVRAAGCILSGLDVWVMIPPKEGTDWLDVLNEEGPEAPGSSPGQALRRARDEAKPWEPVVLAQAWAELERLEAEEAAEKEPLSWEEALAEALAAPNPIAALQEEVIPGLASLKEVELDAALRQVAKGYREHGIRLETLRQEARKARQEAARARKARRDAMARCRETLSQRELVLRNLALKVHSEAPAGAPAVPNPYEDTDGIIRHWRNTLLGPMGVPLCNFAARVTVEEMRDDGAEQTLVFVIEGRLADGKRLPRAEVPAASFPGMGWVAGAWGTQPCIFAGQGTKDHVRCAIQLLSGDVSRRTVYGHLGWRKIITPPSGTRAANGAAEKIEGQWLYLYRGGAIGAEGAVNEVAVEPGDGKLREYHLPEPPAAEELREAIRASLSLLSLAPPMITYSLLSAVWRAPLSEAAFVDFSLFLAGPTGCQKTELTALAQAHYGPGFHGKSLPGNWSATANTLEKQAFLAKDAIFVVDDFAPGGTTSDVQRLHREADRVLRAQGNRAGRGRMKPDGTLRPEYFPRGLILSSGEDIPQGRSLRSRLWILELSPGQVDLQELTRAQEDAARGLLARALAGYLKWLAPQMDQLKEILPPRHRELRTEARTVGVVHDRTPDTLASLAMGWEVFLRFAWEAGAIAAKEAGELWRSGWQNLGEAARAQPEHLESEEPTGRFLALLSAALSSGQVHLADASTGKEPEDPGRWGWRSQGLLDDWQ
ncbi:MAG: toprim domain-containing protein, partial [candidate division NC10 bacterium]